MGGDGALTVECPQVVVSQVHQVLQGGVELLHDTLESERGWGGRRGRRDDGQRQVTGPQDQGAPPTPGETPDSGGAHPASQNHPESWLGYKGLRGQDPGQGPLGSPPAQRELALGRFSCSHWLKPVVCHRAHLSMAQLCPRSRPCCHAGLGCQQPPQGQGQSLASSKKGPLGARLWLGHLGHPGPWPAGENLGWWA